MARYRIHRLKDTPRENFRWAAHTWGLAIVRQRDYEPGDELDAETPYAAWKILQSESRDLRPGDLLETCRAFVPGEATTGPLLILKYIGFEPADWYAPPAKLDQNPSSASSINLASADFPAERSV
jgi:hypothetical protein